MNDKEKTIIDHAQYRSLLKMLNACPEDRVLAFECISNLDIKENAIALALLRKESKASLTDWLKTNEYLIKYQYSLGLKNLLTWPLILKAADKKDVNIKVKELILTEIAEEIKRSFLDFSMIETVDINIIIKADE